MNVLLNYNRTTKAVTQGGNEWRPPVLVFGETLTIAWRFSELSGGQEVDVYLPVDTLRTAAGAVDARPESSQWALQVGDGGETADNTTALLPYDCTAAELEAALAAKTELVADYGAAKVQKIDGSWQVIFGTGAEELTLTARNNTLFPISLLRTGRKQIDGVWVHELRLVQAPVAFADAFDVILPAAPAMAVVQPGETDGALKKNTILSLTMPPEFRGAFQLRTTAGLRTAGLSVTDTIEAVTAALAAIYGGEANLSVTLALDYVLHIQFIGDYEGINVEALEVEPLDPPPGAATQALVFDRDELAVRLRRSTSVTVPLEVHASVEVREDVFEPWVLLRTEITILRPLIFPGLALVPQNNYLRPPSPIDYRLYNPSTVLTGQQYFPAEIGDGSATEIVVDHGLDTTYVRVFVAQNITNGLQLVEGTDFRVRIVDANSVRVISLVGAPAEDAWLVIVMSAQTVGAFAAGLEIEMDQVTGLDDRLTLIENFIALFKSLIPSVTLSAATTSGVALSIDLPARRFLYPGTWPRDTDLEDPKLRGRRFLPAIHDNNITSYSVAPLPTAAAADGNVLRNISAETITIGGLKVADGEYFGSDGIALYALYRKGATDSYFARAMERELWRIEITPEMLRTGRALKVDAELQARAAGTDIDLQCVLVVEWGNILSDTDPIDDAIDLTNAGTGTHTVSTAIAAIGTFTANATTNVMTCAAHGLSNGDSVMVSNSGGALPGGLAAATEYVVRDVTTDTFKLARLLNAPNLEDIDWQVATPLLTARIILADTLQPHPYGVTIARSSTAITATRTLYGGEIGVSVAPPLARFALRARMIDFDTRNPVAKPKGLVYFTSAGTAKI